MDNSPIKHEKTFRELVEAGGHQSLFLPKYSPNLNDIEHDFSTLKIARMIHLSTHILMKLFGIIYCAK